MQGKTDRYLGRSKDNLNNLVGIFTQGWIKRVEDKYDCIIICFMKCSVFPLSCIMDLSHTNKVNYCPILEFSTFVLKVNWITFT